MTDPLPMFWGTHRVNQSAVSFVILGTQSRRNRSPASIGSEPMSNKRAATTLASLLLVASVCAGCSTTSSVGTPPISTVAVPSGWKTYTYGKAKISVPGDWVVKYDTDCPNAAPTGALLLGSSTAPGSCLPFQIPNGVVRVDRLGAKASAWSVPAGQKPVSVNGIPVYVGYGSPSTIQWTVPSLDVQVTGAGPDSNRVVHTLCKA